MYLVPSIIPLTMNYPYCSESDLAVEMGLDPEAVIPLAGDRLWQSTCAIFLSYTLLKCGIPLGKEPKRGDETLIRAGDQKGKHYWMRQHALSNHLLTRIFGKPTYRGGDGDALASAIGDTGGVISFFSMVNYDGGHIDVVTGRHYLMHYRGDSRIKYYDYVSRTADIRFWRATGG